MATLAEQLEAELVEVSRDVRTVQATLRFLKQSWIGEEAPTSEEIKALRGVAVPRLKRNIATLSETVEAM